MTQVERVTNGWQANYRLNAIDHPHLHALRAAVIEEFLRRSAA